MMSSPRGIEARGGPGIDTEMPCGAALAELQRRASDGVRSPKLPAPAAATAALTIPPATPSAVLNCSMTDNSPLARAHSAVMLREAKKKKEEEEEDGDTVPPSPTSGDSRELVKLMSAVEKVSGSKQNDTFAIIEEMGQEEPSVFALNLHLDGTVVIIFSRRKTTVDLLSVILQLFVGAMLLVVLWLFFGPMMEPGGVVFASLATVCFGWFFGISLSKVSGLPPLLGVLIAGMVFGNLLPDWAEGIPLSFSSLVRTVAVVMILTRAGLTFKWSVVRPVLRNLSFLCVFAEIAEAAGHGGMAYYFFNPPNPLFCLFQGFAVTAVSNGIMIPVTTPLREAGYSVARGPVPMMICAGALDNVLGVWLASFVLNLIYPLVPGKPLWMAFAEIPVMIIIGFIIGGLESIILCLVIQTLHERANRVVNPITRVRILDRMRYMSFAIVLLCGLATVFASNKLNAASVGTIAVVTNAGLVSHYFTKDNIKERESIKNGISADMAWFWDIVVTPWLFSIVGAGILVEELLEPVFLLRGLAIIGTGIGGKIIVAFLAQTGTKLNLKERVFTCIGWCTKATIQAALAAQLFLGASQKLSQTDPSTTDPAVVAALQADVIAGRVVMNCIMLSVLTCAIGSGALMKFCGPKLLRKDVDVASK